MYDENDNFYKPLRGSAPQPDHIFLSFCEDPHTTATVSWRTSDDVQEAWLLYRKPRDSDWQRADALNRMLESDIDRSRFYWATARNLEPGTRYIYTVCTREHQSAEFSFETEPENLTKFRFLLISDHQKGSPHEKPDYSIIHNLLQNALRDYPDCRFILTAGDNCDNGQNETQWNGMFAGLAGIIESTPYMMCTGNHDNRGFIQYLPEPVGKFYLEHADYFDAQFAGSYPNNGPKGYETENYFFDYGNAHFLILGINAPEQLEEWAYRDLQDSRQTWKLGCYHFPIYPVMPEGQNNDGYPWLRKPIEQGRLDILFAGHEHSFARSFPTKGEELYDRPSEGTVHCIMGTSSANIFTSNAQKIWHSCFYPQEEPVAMISVIEIDGDKLNALTYLSDGRIVDDFTIDKQNDRILPYALAPVYHRTKMSFKGDMLELIARDISPVEKEGIWFVPFALLVQFIGGKAEKSPGRVLLEVYDHFALFTQGSDIAATDGGDVALCAAVFLEKEQLFIPACDCAVIFGMEWSYAKRNNFLNFNHPSENRTLSRQP